eukprot:INCI603.1.p1 GENE.INCI603.1~~INCI603.1.p1  ORF type:complete len:518 (+),score=108.79 INCI603.1:89-1642(+)
MSLSGGRSAADLDLDAVECSVPLQPLTVAGRQVENIQWQQNTERVQLFISGIRRSDQLKVEFGANHLRVSPSRQGSPAVLDGRLSYEIDPSASYWDVNGTQTVLEVVLIKRLKREWLSLFAPVQSSSTNAGIRSARPKRSASRSDTTQTIGGGDPAARNDPTPNVTASESAEQASTGSSALDQINELRRRLAEKVSALGGQSQSNDKVKSSAPTSGEPIPIAKTKDISSQLVKPPQKLDAAAAAVAEQSQAANGGRFSKWATFDEAAAIAEIENEGKPVAGKDDVAWRVTRGEGKNAPAQISVDEYAKDPEEIALDGELEGKMGQIQQRLQAKLRDAVSCKNRGNAAVSGLHGAPTRANWEVAGMAYIQGIRTLEDLAKNMMIILGPRLKVRTVRTLVDLYNNAALACLKLEQWTEAVKCATIAIQYYDSAGEEGIAGEIPETALVKALFRRAKGKIHCNKKASVVSSDVTTAQVKSALADVQRIVGVAPRDKPAGKLLGVLKERFESGSSGPNDAS